MTTYNYKNHKGLLKNEVLVLDNNTCDLMDVHATSLNASFSNSLHSSLNVSLDSSPSASLLNDSRAASFGMYVIDMCAVIKLIF